MPFYDWRCKCGTTCETVHSMLQVGNPDNHPKCGQCNEVMRRDYRAEACGLADTSRNKGLFPMVDENLTGVEGGVVDSQQHRRRLMKEQGLYERDPTQKTRERLRDSKRRFY